MLHLESLNSHRTAYHVLQKRLWCLVRDRTQVTRVFEILQCAIVYITSWLNDVDRLHNDKTKNNVQNLILKVGLNNFNYITSKN